MEALVLGENRYSIDENGHAELIWQEGGIVDIHEDGHVWGRKEIENPVFRILELELGDVGTAEQARAFYITGLLKRVQVPGEFPYARRQKWCVDEDGNLIEKVFVSDDPENNDVAAVIRIQNAVVRELYVT